MHRTVYKERIVIHYNWGHLKSLPCEQLGNLLSLCKKIAGAYSFYLFFEILWKTAIGKFLRDQNIMVQWFGSFNHGYLFIGILTLVQM